MVLGTRQLALGTRLRHLAIDNWKIDGVAVTDQIETYDYGKLIHVMDLEGNKIELWEPVDVEYDKIVEGRTK